MSRTKRIVKAGPAWTIEQPSADVLIVHLEAKGDDWAQSFLLRSDAHHDSVHCDRAMETRHLDEAVARRAGIFDRGDLFCAMQGRNDKRRALDELRPEHKTDNYIGSLVETATADYRPYADNIIALSPGNHETAVKQNCGVDMTSALGVALGCRVQSYCGWVGFRVSKSSMRATMWMYHHHGSGGSSPVTRGVIATNRMAVYLPDARIVHTGHTHDAWIVPVPRHRVSVNGVPFVDEQLHVKSPGYMRPASDGWAAQKGFAPKPLGAVWLTFSACDGGNHNNHEGARTWLKVAATLAT